VGTEKRERQKANRQVRLAELERAQRSEKRRSRLGLFAVIGAFVLALLLLVRFAGNGDETADDSGLDPDPATTTVPEIETLEITLPEPGGSLTGETPCPAADGSSERITSFEAAPPLCIDPSKIYTAEVSTTKGDYTIELDAEAAPNTVNNFVVLARYHYYDGVPFHRIVPGFVVQGGDAVGPSPGIGNPGYQFDDELPAAIAGSDTFYQNGSVAMANSGINTNGSQFFVVTGENGENLPPQYSRFGQVIEGIDVVMDIEAVGSPSGSPTEEVIITAVTITEN
jgi:peptidylprolyl isomerase/peptidyl-prolyl cis-trans isomerase B (cyclophilin B)